MSFESNRILSRIILAVTIVLMFAFMIIFTGTFFATETFSEVALTSTSALMIKVTISVFFFALLGPSILNWIARKISSRYNLTHLLAIFIAILLISLLLSSFYFYSFDQLVPPNLGPPISPIARGAIMNTFLGALIFSLLEVWRTIEKNQKLQLALSTIEKEHLDSKLAALQQKINPHFLFNSLNVLSELVHEDSMKADKFIHQFSKIYRYVLELNDENFVSLDRELNFLHSYEFLQKIRMDDSLIIKKDIKAESLSSFIPPLSLQLLVENAIKHNSATSEDPLCISISTENDKLVVKNNIRRRKTQVKSSGIGLSKLVKTYQLLGSSDPIFSDNGDFFIAELPLIKSLT